MISLELFSLFALASLANILTPGMGVGLIIMFAAQHGWRAASWGTAGCALGIAALFIAGLAGLGVIVAASPALYTAIKLSGICFLFYYGIRTWRKPAPKATLLQSAAEKRHTKRSLFSTAFLLSVGNPQPLIFCISIFPQFIDRQLPYLPQATIMIASYAAWVFICLSGYAMAADRAREFLLKGDGAIRINKICGTIFCLMAIALFTSELARLI